MRSSSTPLHLLGVVRYQQGHNAEAEELIGAARASLPLAFATTLDTIPAQVPYLRVPTERVD